MKLVIKGKKPVNYSIIIEFLYRFVYRPKLLEFYILIKTIYYMFMY